VALTDEYWSGIAIAGAPDVERAHDLGHGAYALLTFTLPFLGSALFDGALALLADHASRRRLASLGMLGISLGLCGCAVGDGWLSLPIGLACAGAASGMACSASQAELMERGAADREQAMMRWVLFGAIGDVLTPVLAALVISAGGNYRHAFAVAATWTLAHAAWLWPRRRDKRTSASGHAALSGEAGTGSSSDAVAKGLASAASVGERCASAGSSADSAGLEEGGDDPEDVPAVSLMEGLRAGVANRRLWLWLLGAALCTFLDEIVIALGALHAERDLGAAPAAAVAIVTSTSVGGVVGVALSARLLRSVGAERVLIFSAGGASLALLGVLLAPNLFWLGLWLTALGAVAAPQYALLQARAYAALPGRPGVVNALGQVFVVVDVLAPLALGALADRWGVVAALGCLAVQPFGVLALTLWSRRAPASI
jgi:MFS family permease